MSALGEGFLEKLRGPTPFLPCANSNDTLYSPSCSSSLSCAKDECHQTLSQVTHIRSKESVPGSESVHPEESVGRRGMGP